MATKIDNGRMSTTSTNISRSPVRQMLAPPSINVDEVFHTRTEDQLLSWRPNTRGEPTTCVILSITNGKSGMLAMAKTEWWGGCVVGEDIGGLNGNSKGLVGKVGRVGLLRMVSMREPTGTSGGGLGGGRSKTGAAGGGGSAGGGSKAGAAGKSSKQLVASRQGSPMDGATANKTEGARAFGTFAGSPVGGGIWSDPTH